MKVYVKAMSKKDINQRLSQGETIYGTNYSLFGGGGTYRLQELNDGDVVAVYQHTSGGTPIAKAWGTWNTKKQQLK